MINNISSKVSMCRIFYAPLKAPLNSRYSAIGRMAFNEIGFSLLLFLRLLPYFVITSTITITRG